MNRAPGKMLIVMAAAATLLAVPAAAQADRDHDDYPKGVIAVGLTTDQRLASFKVNRPETVQPIAAVTGLVGDTKLVGIDYRVQDGLLYGVGGAGGVYTLDTTTAVATKVSQLTVALDGALFGVDFNPAADRLRVISDKGQNLAHDLTTDTTTAQDPLTYPGVGPATGVTAAAYTNNDLNADTNTTLFDLDTTLNQAVVQSPPALGFLQPTGLLGVDAAADAGFDIYSSVRDGRSVHSTGFATLSVSSVYGSYLINLFTGHATSLGAFPPGIQVTDLAVQLDKP